MSLINNNVDIFATFGPAGVLAQAKPWAVMYAEEFMGTEYRVIIDLNRPGDTETYSYVEIHGSFFNIDKEVTSAGAIQIGVIKSIGPAGANIIYPKGTSFRASADKDISRDRQIGSSFITCLVENGETPMIESDFFENDVAEINDTDALTTIGGGSVVPAVGDLICKFTASGNHKPNLTATLSYRRVK